MPMNPYLAARLTREKIEPRLAPLPDVLPRRAEDGRGYPHALWMLQEVGLADGMSIGKANRWLGWAQCLLMHQGLITLNECKAINAEAQARPHPEQVETWQPIVTAPKDGTFILAYGCTLPTYVYVIVWEDGEWKYCSQGGGWASPPSLPSWWMPIPKMPEGGKS